MFFVICGYMVYASFRSVRRYAASRPLRTWSNKRKIYALCWLGCLACYAAGFILEAMQITQYRHFCIGAATLLLAAVPCGIKLINRYWWLSLPRNVFFITFGVLETAGLLH